MYQIVEKFSLAYVSGKWSSIYTCVCVCVSHEEWRAVIYSRNALALWFKRPSYIRERESEIVEDCRIWISNAACVLRDFDGTVELSYIYIYPLQHLRNSYTGGREFLLHRRHWWQLAYEVWKHCYIYVYYSLLAYIVRVQLCLRTLEGLERQKNKNKKKMGWDNAIKKNWGSPRDINDLPSLELIYKFERGGTRNFTSPSCPILVLYYYNSLGQKLNYLFPHVYIKAQRTQLIFHSAFVAAYCVILFTLLYRAENELSFDARLSLCFFSSFFLSNE